MTKISTEPQALDCTGFTPLAALGTRVLCLYRVSSEQQLYRTDDHQVDIPMQRIRCREYAAANGWTIVCELQEEGVSGYKVRAADRDKIQLIKEYALKKQFDILLVFMFDRIGRIADETPFVVEWLVNNGIRVISASEGEQKFETHADRLMNYIRYWQADGESQKTALRTANSLHILTEQGYFTGGCCPYGYSFVKAGRTNKKKQEVNDLVICEEEARIVEIIFYLAANEGYGAQRIANYLHKNGIKNRRNQNWHPSTIHAMLKNVTYIGILRSGESHSSQLPHLRIIDDAVFEKVQALLLARSKIHIEEKAMLYPTKAPALVSGFIFCSDCGARLYVTTSGRGRRRADGTEAKRTRYGCQTKTRSHGNCTGQSVYVLERVDTLVETYVLNLFSKIKRLSKRDAVNACLRRMLREKELNVQTAKSIYEKVERDYQALQAEIIKAVSGQSLFSAEMLNSLIIGKEKERSSLSHTLAEAADELEQAKGQAALISQQFDQLLDLAELYPNSTIDGKKMILSRIIDKVVIYRGYRMEIHLNEEIRQFFTDIDTAI